MQAVEVFQFTLPVDRRRFIMKFLNGLSRAVQVNICLIVSLAVLLASCGGGGGSSSQPPPTPPLVQALLLSFPAGSAPASFPNAIGTVQDGSTGANITNANVTMNGVTLTYNSALTHQQYEGTLVINPGDAVTLVVKVGGSTFTASGTQVTSYPTISAPVSGVTWSTSSANTVTWSGGAPLTNAAYLVGVLDAADPAGGTAFFQAVCTCVNSFSIPANSLTARSSDLIVGITTFASIPNAAANSSFAFGGFNYVPITVYTWTPRTFGGGTLTSVIWSGTKFVAVGWVPGPFGVVYTSPDGVTWTAQTVTPTPSSVLNGVTWSGTQFVVVGVSGTVLTSPDGVTWTTRASGASLSGVAWSGTNFAAVGPNGVIVTSPDGVTWTARTSGTANGLGSVAWSGTNFVAVGDSGTILTSPDGVTWTTQTSGTANGLGSVAWSGTNFAAVGNGVILTSPDGVTWTTRTSGTANILSGVTWSGTQFVAVGYGGGIATSPDGVTWTNQISGTVFNLFSVAASGTEIVAAGDSIILTSP
jgi:hypothetical protein